MIVKNEYFTDYLNFKKIIYEIYEVVIFNSISDIMKSHKFF